MILCVTHSINVASPLYRVYTSSEIIFRSLNASQRTLNKIFKKKPTTTSITRICWHAYIGSCKALKVISFFLLWWKKLNKFWYWYRIELWCICELNLRYVNSFTEKQSISARSISRFSHFFMTLIRDFYIDKWQIFESNTVPFYL